MNAVQLYLDALRVQQTLNANPVGAEHLWQLAVEYGFHRKEAQARLRKMIDSHPDAVLGNCPWLFSVLVIEQRFTHGETLFVAARRDREMLDRALRTATNLPHEVPCWPPEYHVNSLWIQSTRNFLVGLQLARYDELAETVLEFKRAHCAPYVFISWSGRYLLKHGCALKIPTRKEAETAAKKFMTQWCEEVDR